MFYNLTLSGLDIKYIPQTGLLVGIDVRSLILVDNVDDIFVEIVFGRAFSVIGDSKVGSGHIEIPICAISDVFSESPSR